jgi:alpha-L-fucosidase
MDTSFRFARRLGLSFLCGAGFCFIMSRAVNAEFEPAWDSLETRNPAPEWFQDAKLGIYFHWGVYSVPAFGSEWYPRNMYIKQNREYAHHVKTYGDPSEFGYPDFVPMFKAENFDANEWADLFVRAGARFAGPVAEHHDGYSMWDSEWTPWNSMDTGPHRDITGELEKAVRARDLRFVTTFHHARNNLWLKNGQWTGHYEYVKKDFPQLLEDPVRAIMYGYIPREDFLKMWKGKLQEVIDRYSPDLIWFDSWLDEIPEPVQLDFLAYYLNSAAADGREVVVTCKQEDIRRSVAVEDFEKGRADHLTDYVWLTDDTISRGSWCYTEDLQIKPTAEVLHSLIDIISKNGVLLLNISPMADGTIPDNQRKVLEELGAWLEVCGEAVYNTRPWLVYGEGPTKMGRGGAFIRFSGEYTPADIRYTRSKDHKVLYATSLGKPEGKLVLRSLNVKNADGRKGEVSMLGYDRPLEYRILNGGELEIDVSSVPAGEWPARFATSFKISGFEIELNPFALFSGDSAISLPADRATLEGSQIALENRTDRANIGFWDRPGERAHWLANFTRVGNYLVRGEFAAPAAGRKLAVRIGDQRVVLEAPATGAWDRPDRTDAQVIRIEKPGILHVILEPADPADWQAVNVWSLEFAAQAE